MFLKKFYWNHYNIITHNNHFSFKLISYVPFNNKVLNQSNFLKSKRYFKNSYLLLSWFYYFTYLNEKKKSVKFLVQPQHKFMFTQTKAPMAHKKWSKEQFQFKYYSFTISFKSNLNKNYFSENSLLLNILFIKKFFLISDSNLLFFKSYYLSFFISDKDNFRQKRNVFAHKR